MLGLDESELLFVFFIHNLIYYERKVFLEVGQFWAVLIEEKGKKVGHLKIAKVG